MISEPQRPAKHVSTPQAFIEKWNEGGREGRKREKRQERREGRKVGTGERRKERGRRDPSGLENTGRKRNLM